MAKERLDRMLSRLGYCSRSQLRGLLDLVTVDGEPAHSSDQKAEADQVRWEGQRLDPDPLWILLHKPAGYTCSHRDDGELIFDLFPERFQARRPVLSTVGRLDKDTTGVLLLTTDGQALHRLISPKSQTEKVYEVTLLEPPKESDLDKIRQGGWCLVGDPKPLMPCQVEVTGPSQVRMILHEGRYHQVKRCWEEFGNRVEKLHRSRFGEYRVDHLAPGEFEVWSPK